MEEAPDVYCAEHRGRPEQDRGHRKSKTANNTISTFNETLLPSVGRAAVVTLSLGRRVSVWC